MINKRIEKLMNNEEVKKYIEFLEESYLEYKGDSMFKNEYDGNYCDSKKCVLLYHDIDNRLINELMKWRLK